MKIYTKTGDKGETSLFGGKRVSKSGARIDAYGQIDELNALLGVVRVLGQEDNAGIDLFTLLLPIQNELFVIGAHLATPYQSNDLPVFTDASVQRLETEIDEMEKQLPPISNFILPGGTTLAAQLHLARTVCRRAERVVVRLANTEPVLPEILAYLNRLSDFLFVLARAANHHAGVVEAQWKKEK